MLRDRDFSIFMTLLWPWPWSDVPQNWIISRYYPRVHVYEFSAKSNHNCRCRSANTQTDRQTNRQTNGRYWPTYLSKKKNFFFLPSNKWNRSESEYLSEYYSGSDPEGKSVVNGDSHVKFKCSSNPQSGSDPDQTLSVDRYWHPKYVYQIWKGSVQYSRRYDFLKFHPMLKIGIF